MKIRCRRPVNNSSTVRMKSREPQIGQRREGTIKKGGNVSIARTAGNAVSRKKVVQARKLAALHPKGSQKGSGTVIVRLPDKRTGKEVLNNPRSKRKANHISKEAPAR